MEQKQVAKKLKLLCIGVTGRLGLVFAENALADGHSVKGVLRRAGKEPNTLASNQVVKGSGASSEVLGADEVEAVQPPHAEVIRHANLATVVADLKSEDALAELMAGIDAVVVTLGAWPQAGKPFTLHQDITKAYAPAMKKAGVSRVLVCYGMGLLFPFNPDKKGPFQVMRADMNVALETIKECDLDYTIWCPGDFPHGPRSQAYEEAAGKPPSMKSVTTGMVADAMLKELVANKYSKQLVGIARTDQ